MDHLSCMTCGETVDLQLDFAGERLKYEGKVNGIDKGSFSVEIQDEGLPSEAIHEGAKAFLYSQERKTKFHFPVIIESTENLPLVRIKEINSRSHVRADGYLRLKCENLSEEEFLKKKEQYVNEIIPDLAIQSADPAIYLDADKENEIDPMSTKLKNELNILNRKFHALQRLMFNTEEIAIFEQKPLKVNMSGSGIRFNTDQSYQIGDLLDIKMVLPTSPFFIVKVIGLVLRINRTSPHSSPVSHAPSYAVKYLAIHEDSREAIIKCVFTWLRKFLREKKRTH